MSHFVFKLNPALEGPGSGPRPPKCVLAQRINCIGWVWGLFCGVLRAGWREGEEGRAVVDVHFEDSPQYVGLVPVCHMVEGIDYKRYLRI